VDRPVEAYMHVGIVQFMLYPDLQSGDGPIVETAESLADDEFFHALEITRINDVQERRSMRRLAESSHLTLGYGAHPQILSGALDLSSADPELRTRSITEVKASIDEAAELGVSMLTLLDGPNSAPRVDETEAAVDRVVTSLTELCAHAAPHNMWVALEQFDRSIEKKSLLGPIELCVRVSEMVRASTPNFGLCLDLSHLPLLGEDPETSLRTAGAHLIQAHIGNCIARDQDHPQYGDQHPVFGDPAGENDVPELAAYLKTLLEIGYFEQNLPTPMPLVSFEMKPASDQSAAMIIGNCKRTFQLAWAQV